MIGRRTGEAHRFISGAGFLFITFGTARVNRLAENGRIVSNCLKLPSRVSFMNFLQLMKLLELWTTQLDKLNRLYPDLKVVFTISPVRHWKDGSTWQSG